MDNSTEVAIIGAGPTGLSLAAQLMRYRIKFFIIEKNREPTVLSKALAVHARTIEIFKELGVAKRAISEGQPVNSLTLMRGEKQKARVDISRLGEGMSEFPFVLTLEQSRTEKILLDFLNDNGQQVHWGSELLGMEPSESGVSAHYRDSSGLEQKIKARYLIGCDGAHSSVRNQLGLSLDGDTEPRLFYVADVLIKSTVIQKKEFYFFLTPKGFILFFSMKGEGHYRIVGVLPGQEAQYEQVSFGDIQGSIVRDVGCPLEITKLIWFSTYKVSSRKAVTFSGGSCFICGDAAHIHTPAGGQGMNTGIQDGYNLAWKLALVLRGQISTRVLDTYSSERTKNAVHLLRTTDRLFEMMAGTNIFWDFFRQYVFPFLAKAITKSSIVKKKVFPLLSQTGIAYPDSWLTERSRVGDVKGGDRMPYFIAPDGKSVYDLLTTPGFKILCFGEKRLEDSFVSTLSLPCEVHHFKSAPSAIFGKESNFYILLRPDNHISYIGRELSTIGTFLNKVKGG